MTDTRKKFYLKDYKAPTFWQDKVDLIFRLFSEHTEVEATSHFKFNNDAWSWPQAVELDGEHLELLSLSVNGAEWKDYAIENNKLFLKNVPEDFQLTVKTKIYPSKNKSMEGLYESKGLFCT
ncbi:MAG: aminopeptidase N, partial [Bdellovibrionota bacterium]